MLCTQWTPASHPFDEDVRMDLDTLPPIGLVSTLSSIGHLSTDSEAKIAQSLLELGMKALSTVTQVESTHSPEGFTDPRGADLEDFPDSASITSEETDDDSSSNASSQWSTRGARNFRGKLVLVDEAMMVMDKPIRERSSSIEQVALRKNLIESKVLEWQSGVAQSLEKEWRRKTVASSGIRKSTSNAEIYRRNNDLRTKVERAISEEL